MIFELPSCTGCKTCEMACSLQHFGEFNPEKAAIRVQEKKDRAVYLLSFSDEGDGQRASCIGCFACVETCPVGEDLEKLIRLQQDNKKNPATEAEKEKEAVRSGMTG